MKTHKANRTAPTAKLGFDPFAEIGANDPEIERLRAAMPFMLEIARDAFEEVGDKGFVAARAMLFCLKADVPPPQWLRRWQMHGLLEMAKHEGSEKRSREWLPGAWGLGGKRGRKKAGHGATVHRRAEIVNSFVDAVVLEGVKVTKAYDTIGGRFNIGRKAVEDHVYAFFKERLKGARVEDFVWTEKFLDFIALIGPGTNKEREARRQKFEEALKKGKNEQ